MPTVDNNPKTIQVAYVEIMLITLCPTNHPENSINPWAIPNTAATRNVIDGETVFLEHPILRETAKQSMARLIPISSNSQKFIGD